MADGGQGTSQSSGSDKSGVTKVLPLIIILAPLIVHFILVCFVLVIDWLPTLFLFSHVFFFLTGAWIVHHRDSLLPIFMYIVVVAVTVLMDIIQLGLYYDDREDMYGRGDSRWARTWQFSAAMMIISLMVKPLTIALACVALYLRSGVTLTNLLGRQGAYSVIAEQQTS